MRQKNAYCIYFRRHCGLEIQNDRWKMKDVCMQRKVGDIVGVTKCHWIEYIFVTSQTRQLYTLRLYRDIYIYIYIYIPIRYTFLDYASDKMQIVRSPLKTIEFQPVGTYWPFTIVSHAYIQDLNFRSLCPRSMSTRLRSASPKRYLQSSKKLINNLAIFKQ